ncbi:uncharacterized protein LOC120109008 [Phoenix dactylifera]|uniref:Uncharacterized protein LOC120109008 n=1 Tax=Phoenix dactylifera TaxID=42345 RepID=A0A8B8ZWJ2_PHODC|nr:uncharacterized protein LOC120109008 [Phoenix dactylifera]
MVERMDKSCLPCHQAPNRSPLFQNSHGLGSGEAVAGGGRWIPSKFYDSFVLHGLRVDLVEPGRLLCSVTVPPSLQNAGNFLHGGATASPVDLVGSAGAPIGGAPLEIGIAYLDAAFVRVRSFF